MVWPINIVICDDEVVIDDPPNDDPPAEDCMDFENPCPCDTAADYPEGWRCIGGAGNKISIPG